MVYDWPNCTNGRSGEWFTPAQAAADGIAQFVNDMHTQFGVNIGVLEYAVGTTSSAQWAQGGAEYIQTVGPGSSPPYGILKSDVGGDAELIVYNQGQYEANHLISGSTWITNTTSFLSGIRTNTRSNIAFALEMMGWQLTGGSTDSVYSAIKNAQFSFLGSTANSFLAGTTNDCSLNGSDLIHCNGASNKPLSDRIVQSYANYLSVCIIQRRRLNRNNS